MGEMKAVAGDLEDLIPLEEKDCDLDWVHLFNGQTLTNDIFVRQHCWKPWCIGCERARVWRMRDRILKYIDHWGQPLDQWYFMTRSVQTDHGLHCAFNALRAVQQREREWLKDPYWSENPMNFLNAWVQVTEITYNWKSGYHVHLHMIACSQIRWGKDQLRQLHALWNKSARLEAAQLHVSPVHDIKGVAAYLSKYMQKQTWGGLSRGRAYMVRESLKGRNRIAFKRGTALPRPDRGYLLCCLPPTDYCGNPGVTLRPE